MSINPNLVKKWPGTIMKKYTQSTESTEDTFKIIAEDESKLDLFYIMFTPSGGHYKNQTHILEFKAKCDNPPTVLFPFTPPRVKFITKIFHPNISISGSVCVDILNDIKAWSPTYSFSNVINSIILLLDVPNNASPYNTDASRMFTLCNNEFKTKSNGMHDHKAIEAAFENSFRPFDEYANRYANNTYVLSMYLPRFASIQNKEKSEDDIAKSLEKTKI